MLRAQSIIDRDQLPARMLLTVHDELVFEVAAERAEAFGAQMKREMESIYELDVPLKVDVGIAKDWAGAH